MKRQKKRRVFRPSVEYLQALAEFYSPSTCCATGELRPVVDFIRPALSSIASAEKMRRAK